jgi:selenocysteine lyase/cysteine desulfurase
VLLNDLFGVQSRAGCMCAGPYIQRILGISPEVVRSLCHLVTCSLAFRPAQCSL